MSPKFAALAFCLALQALPSPARAQISAQIQLSLPVAPPLVVVQPGIQVVQDYDDEVFVYGGGYWLRRGRHWYRAPRPGVAFVLVEPRVVPVALYRLPPGRYVRYHNPPGHDRRMREERKAAREREKEARKAHREREREERKARHEWEEGERREEHHHPGHDHGER